MSNWYDAPVPDDAGEASGTSKPALLPEGEYAATFVEGEYFESFAKGTPGFALKFRLVDAPDRVVRAEVWISEGGASITEAALRAVGWNGSLDAPEFSKVGEELTLWMKHDTWKGKTREKWNVKTPRQVAGPAQKNMAMMFAERFKSSAPAPAAPTAAPKATLPKPPAKAAAPAKPKAPPKPSVKRATTLDEAWATWAHAGHEDGTLFYAAIDEIRGERDIDALTADEWAQVEAKATPF